MKSLIIRGSFRGATGYDHHTREFAKELAKQGVQVQLIDFAKWTHIKLAPEQLEDGLAQLCRPVSADLVLHFTMPPQVEMTPGLRHVNYTMFEATRIPAQWLQHNLKHDLVIVPAQSSKDAWVESGYPETRLGVCPFGINTQVFHNGIAPLDLKDARGVPIREYKTRVLNISHLSPRKNLISLLRVWIQSTSKNDDAILLVKWDCPWQRWLYKFFLDIKMMELQIGKSRKEGAPILFLINNYFSDAEVPRLYAAATHYWSMSHGEGWDLCTMEAAAAGLHLIAPAHSGYMAYLDSSVADMIPSHGVPAIFRWAYGMHKLFRGAQWWQPAEDQAADFIQKAVKAGAGTKGQLAQSRIRERFTWSQATSRLLQILNELT